MNEYIALTEKELSALFKNGSGIAELYEPMCYSLMAGGKRVRPILCFEFARANGGDIKKALPFAMAVELIHTYSLIHDDLPCMDNDDYRRGRLSCHKAFGEANALLAGDALLTLAFEVIATAPQKYGTDASACLKAGAVLSKLAGRDGMVGGQVLDLKNENKPIDYDTLKLTHLLKTSALIKAACVMGAYAAKADENEEKRALLYGESLGLAFQNIDDILDVEGDFKSLGKKTGMDENKVTFVSLLSLEKAKELAEKTTNEALQQLEGLNDNYFLKELTKSLLNRNR